MVWSCPTQTTGTCWRPRSDQDPQVIVTENLSDFPASALAQYGIEAQTADFFVLHLLDLSPAAVAGVIERQAAALRNPQMTVAEVLDHLSTSGLPRSVAVLRQR